jgi:subtilisin family serine protease
VDALPHSIRAAALFLVDEVAEELIFEVALGQKADEVKKFRGPLGHGIAGLVGPYLFYYNPEPPVEFGAPGIDVRVAWAEGGWITATGNSFAAPHITGIVAKILGKHPGLTIFQVKTVLRALSANVSREEPR